ncbi:MAG: cysteine desulfurase [Gammaproteobacteria bacterium]|nr:cysteine desulfurase [Gammaproteobacteria bacterium]
MKTIRVKPNAPLDHYFASLRNDFPILRQTNRGKPLIYLDSASSAQKPQQVIDAISFFYSHDYANIHRGIYELSERATHLYEQVRSKVKTLIHAQYADEIVFVRGTTEAFNLLATTLGEHYLQSGDEIILSVMEHHANIVPWYFLQKKLGIHIRVTPLLPDGSLDIEAYKKLFSARTKLVSLAHASNALGIINPVKELTTIAHQHDVPIIIDGAQAVPHLPVDVSDIDCDFYIFSGHKLYGPTGAGVLYGKASWLAKLPPYQGGGDMIETVAFDHVTFAKPPQRFEAGTQDLASVVGLGAAIDYVQQIGMQEIYHHEQALLHYATARLNTIPGLKIIGTAKEKMGVISFVIEGIHPHDVGTILDDEGIAVRASHHCAMPLMQYLQVPATIRASLGLYNNENEIDALVEAILVAKRLFS